MVAEKKLTQEQKEANWVAFAEYLEQKKHESQKRFDKKMKDESFLNELETLPKIELKSFAKKY